MTAAIRSILSMLSVLRGALPALAMLLCAPALADTPITLFKSFAGNINMTGTQKTLRTASNNSNACSTAESVTMNLSGIPNGSTVLAAYLYWAGSGGTADYAVTFDGKAISAPANRRYASATVGYNYFGGAADVTDQVKARGNASYTAGGLTINKDLFCAVQGVLGGFQLLVVYSQSSETFRVLNVYEGFQYIRNSSVELTLANFLTPNPIGSLTGRVGHITWEGDSTLQGGGETLQYNGVEQADLYNPTGNQFNSISSVNADQYSYGIDFDVYTVKSPVIAGGQKSAKTLYTSGNDLVLLNAEVIAAPNVPATDRGVTLTLNGPLVPSSATTYTISVVNNGPMDEGGPLTVSGTLPAALIYGGASGSGWSCAVQGQLLTCTYSGLVTKNTTLPPITLTVTPGLSASGLVSFGVTVGGKLFDYYDGNDTSTVSTRVGNQTFTPVFVFTDKECVHNRAFGHAQQPCKRLTPDFVLANKDLSTFITYVAKDVPTALASTETTLPMRFALSCHNPSTTAGTKGSYNLRSGTVTLPACEPNGAIPAQNSAAWSTASNIRYPAGSPSSRATTASDDDDPADFLLRYPDVGRIELFVTDNQARLGSTGAFVSKPNRLLLLAQSTNKAGDPASAADPRFVTAGTPFTMTVRAMMVDLSTPAPNFGREDDPVKIKLVVGAATTADGSPIAAMVTRTKDEEPVGKLSLGKNATFGPFSAGIATGSTFIFDDVGVIRVESMIMPTAEELLQNSAIEKGSYLGSGSVDGTPINVGRFYADHFDTVVTGPMACLAAAQCPDPKPVPVPAAKIDTMAYSLQPFTTVVTARSATGAALNNYRLELARDVALAPFTAPNGTTAQRSPSSTTSSGTVYSTLSNKAIAASAFTGGVATIAPTYAFPAALAYSPTASTTSPSPVSVYLRATESSGTDAVTSQRAAAVEGGVRIVAGRLFVPDSEGSAAGARNIAVKAQFFAGQWVDASTDSTSAFTSADVRFSECEKLANGPACKLALTVNRLASATLVDGAGTVMLAAPAAGSNGSVYMWVSTREGVALPVWLPSMRGKLIYGTRPPNPYIYLREIY
ncbi:hypothetical protein GJV26_29220 [Massilia dura]|uniref:Uncharacterized protein n=1 Tax=Pseudoduganella dura TaxID=321982 RepID=A0A6I3XJ79_9BURK|nr:DUF6701 domain-containing protein [Pseudoduganella dura]MUI16509.1 hypothetical protein [Pseudoduganella dura]GGX87359.1 hypothetical protein GCM10007386_17800 [Pseudoduganella dura]